MKVIKLRSGHWMTSLPCRVADAVGLVLNQRDRITPPAGMFGPNDLVDGSRSVRDFILTGESTFRTLKTQGLKPTDRVLDLGCGIGRMAIPMVGWLEGGGSYDGLDITLDKIRYCNRTIARRASNFRFHHADIYSQYYNPKATTQAKDYRFPFPDASFDFVLLMSVFTHMLPEDMENYLSEVSRVMAPGGNSVITFYLTEATRGAPWHRVSDVCEIFDPAKPEHGVLYVQDYIKDCYQRNGLSISNLVHGTQSGYADANPATIQDVISATRISPQGHARS